MISEQAYSPAKMLVYVIICRKIDCMLYVTCHMLHYNDMLRLILSISILHFLVKKID